MASSPSWLGTAAGTESRVPWWEGTRGGAETPREGKGEREACEKPSSPGRGRGRAASPPASHSLTHSHAWVAAAASSPEPAPTPAPPRGPGRGRGWARASPGHIILTIGERNYRAYGNHGLELLRLNSELSPTASLLCPAPPQRRTDRCLPPHCAGAPARGSLGAVVPLPSRLGRARAGPGWRWAAVGGGGLG